ncbi:DUF6531 domain-containing protein [Streptomyces sp. NPDC005859]|uniref:DUF6531 domain-containing protein n=1 Tax=Streptomyces sp. NPDC005859 TaxID=3157170 RepID=UPI0034005297
MTIGVTGAHLPVGEIVHSRAFGALFWRAHKRATHLAAAAVVTSSALALSLLPAADAAAADTRPVSVWGKDAPRFTMPEVRVGSTKPVATRPEREPSKPLAAWRKAQREHATKPAPQAGKVPLSAAKDAGILSLVPEGQGDVPWHRITDFAITDALTARIDYSTGNLMLTGTDFDVAGVGQRLTLARTYNSLDAPWGKVSQRWWQQYERYLSLGSSEVVFYDSSGATVRFTKNSDGSVTTPKGYSQEHLFQGDTTGLWGDVAGVVAGGLAAAACGAAVAASAPATLGGSLAATTGCYAISWSVGQIASNAVSGG